MISETNLAARRQELQRAIPSFYNPYLFFGLTNVLGIVAIYYSTRLLENVKPLEWLHLLYHLPEGSRLGELALIRALKRHHQTHHNPALMNDCNFNITFPIWDWVKGTLHRQINTHA